MTMYGTSMLCTLLEEKVLLKLRVLRLVNVSPEWMQYLIEILSTAEIAVNIEYLYVSCDDESLLRDEKYRTQYNKLVGLLKPEMKVSPFFQLADNG